MRASSRLRGCPKSGLPCPPATLFMATGISERPMMVTTEPVTTVGKNLSSLPYTGAASTTNRPDIMIAP
ncbi:hypothetical protein D3C76_1508220 [compost metagenome]